MHINRKLISALLMAVCAPALTAADGVSVIFHHSDETRETVDLDKLHKITFSDGSVVAHLDDGDRVMSLDGLHCFTFNDELSSASRLTTDGGTNVYIAAATLHVSGYNTNKPEAAALYNLSGAILMQTSALTVDALDVSSLPAGVYIFKLGNRTYKLYK